MGFYGNIMNTTKSQFTFDKVYQNRTVMDNSIKDGLSDGVFIGRFVLVDYDKEDELIRQVYDKGDDENGYLYSDPGCFNAIRFNSQGIQIENNLVTGINLGDVCYVIKNKNRVYYECTGSKADYEEDVLYAVFSVLTEIPENQKWSYIANYEKDRQTYGGNIGRGWDSTVWQKMFENGKEYYAMVAELNAVVPTFNLTVDYPTLSPIAPHFDEVSNNTYYEIHWQPQWGLRVKSANGLLGQPLEKIEDPETGEMVDPVIYSDEMTTWVQEVYNSVSHKNELYYYGIDEEWHRIESLNDIPIDGYLPADIYYNKRGFSSDVHFRSAKEDSLNISPTGFSETPTFYSNGLISWEKTKYNDHRRGERIEKEDTKELSMILPSLGNAVNEMWDIVYGKGVDAQGNKLTDETIKDDTEYNRLKFIDWEDGNANTSTQRLRLIDKNADGYTTYRPDDVETLAGAINSAHDLMGMIIVDTTKFEEPLDITNQTQLESIDGDKIYYLSQLPEQEGDDYQVGYYRKALDYNYEPVDYIFEEFEKDVIAEVYEPKTYYIYSEEEKDWIDDIGTSYQDGERYAKKIIDTSSDKYKAYETAELAKYNPGKFFYKENEYNYINENSLAARDVVYYSIDNTKIIEENIIENYAPNVFHKIVEEDAYIKAYTGKNKYEPNKYYIYNKEKKDYELCKATKWTKGKTYYYIDENLNYKNAYVTSEENLYEKDKYFIYNGTEYVKSLDETFNENIVYYQLVKKDNYYLCSDEVIKKDDQQYYRINESDNIPVLNMYINAGRDLQIQNPEQDPVYFWVPQAFATPIIEDVYDEDGNPVRDEQGNIQTELKGWSFTASDDVLDEKLNYFLLDWRYGIITDPITQEQFEGAIVDRFHKVKLINFDDSQNYYYYNEETKTYTRVLYDNISAEYADLGALRNKDIDPTTVSFLKKNVYYINKTGKENPEIDETVIPYTYPDFYFKNKFYYKDQGDYLLDTNDTLYFEYDEENNKIIRQYLSFEEGAIQRQNLEFYVPNKYYWFDEDEKRYKLDKNLIMQEGVQYYTKNDLYVSEDLLGLYPVGAVWNRAAEFVPCSIEVATRTPKYKMVLLDGFGRQLNTLNGLILNINKLLLQGDYHTRDRNTVQGVINTVNDIINRFNHLIPGQLLTTDSYGRVHSTKIEQDENSWIGVKLNSYPDNTFLTINHLYPNKEEDNNTFKLDLNDSNNNLILETTNIDDTGHVKSLDKTTVTLPFNFKTILTNDKNVEAKQIMDSLEVVGDSAGWIKTAADSNANKIIIQHTQPVANTYTKIEDIAPQFGGEINITDSHFDSNGHMFTQTTHKITLPKGSLVADAEKTTSNVITGIDFEDTSGKITISRTDLSALQLKGYLTPDTGVVADGQTVNDAFKNIENRIIKETSDRQEAINNKIETLNASSGETSINSSYTIKSWKEEKGIINIEIQQISIPSSAISDIATTYDEEGTNAVTGKSIAAALSTLKLNEVKNNSQPIIAISQTNGVVSATPGNISKDSVNGLGTMASENAGDYTKTSNLGSMAFKKDTDYVLVSVYNEKITALESEIARLEALIKSYHEQVQEEPTE